MSKNDSNYSLAPTNNRLGINTKFIAKNLSWWQELYCCAGRAEKVFDSKSIIALNDCGLAELFNSKAIIAGEANVPVMKAKIFSFFDSQHLRQISKDLAINFANNKIDEIAIEVATRIDPSHQPIIVFGCSDRSITLYEIKEAIKLEAEKTDSSLIENQGNIMDNLDIYFFAYTSELANIQAIDNGLTLAGLNDDYMVSIDY